MFKTFYILLKIVKTCTYWFKSYCLTGRFHTNTHKGSCFLHAMKHSSGFKVACCVKTETAYVSVIPALCLQRITLHCIRTHI